MEVRSVKAAAAIDWKEALGERVMHLEANVDEEKKIITVSFLKSEIQVSEIIAAVMAVTDVKDIQIQETELSQIVKEIYNHGVKAGLNQ